MGSTYQQLVAAGLHPHEAYPLSSVNEGHGLLVVKGTAEFGGKVPRAVAETYSRRPANVVPYADGPDQRLRILHLLDDCRAVLLDIEKNAAPGSGLRYWILGRFESSVDGFVQIVTAEEMDRVLQGGALMLARSPAA